MSFNLQQNERVLWEGRGVPQKWGWPVSLLLFLLMVGGVFYWSTVAGVVVAIFAFVLWISFLAASILSTVAIRARRYVITNNRVVLAMGIIAKRMWELPLQYISSIEVPQSSAQKVGGIGKILFLSFQARSVAFVRVREPMRVRQIALDAKSRLPNSITPGQGPQVIEREIITREVLIKCPNCGSTYPQGTLRCQNCGASL